ncbi:F-box/LRR-repeat protein At1g48400-like isoform X2 [Brassica napus]|uniref:F-box/LRR-repeat protein At1g48400-like isoform X2 n=1 Tax=Brassica napus TaxID=3708 RepID=UPI0020787225|nr:F-box/LRR-repeat protein At1g48400-like isoform X2 [Brassica napus]
MGDSISSLPDEILGKLLSLVPTKEAASTSVLSKRWRNLLSLVDRLSFDESMVVYPNEEEATKGSQRFCDFVDKTLALLHNSPAIKTFSLCRVAKTMSHNHESARLNRWIWTAMEQGLLELHLYAPANSDGEDSDDEDIDESLDVFFPALKSLSLMVALDIESYPRIIHACPVLEELTIRNGDFSDMGPLWGGTVVEHASIKRLVIATHVPHHIDYYLLLEYFQNACQTVRFQAPSLVYLDYSSLVFRKYDVGDLDSLVEARLSLKLWRSTSHYDYDDDYYYDCSGSLCDDDDPSPPIFGDVTCLVAAIRNITTLHLSPDSLEVFHFCCKSMPIFNNLLNLSIESNNQNGWQVMPLLLKSCPNLQTLVFKGLVHKVTNRCGDACACNPQNPSLKNSKKMKKKKKICCLQTCPVKVLEISNYGGCFQEVEQMRHFLGNLKCLETVKVGVDPDNKGNAEFLRANLMNLPKLSSKCTIQLL